MRISDWSSDVCSSDLAWDGMNGHPPNRSGKGLRNASLNQQFIMTTSRNISWHKRKKETAGNNPAVSNFCVMDARLLGGVLSNVAGRVISRSEEHTSELQSLMRISYAVFCLTK